MTAVRAEPYPYGSSELLDLEAYLMKRASGMPLETPGCDSDTRAAAR